MAFSEHGWGNFTLKAAGANLGHFVAKFENGRDQMISGGFEGNLIYCRLKFGRLKRPNRHIVEQSSPNLRSFENFDVQSHRMEVLQIAVG